MKNIFSCRNIILPSELIFKGICMYLTWQVRYNHTKSGSIMLYHINYLIFFQITYLRQMNNCRLCINVIILYGVKYLFKKLRLESYRSWLNINTQKSYLIKCCCFLNYTKSFKYITSWEKYDLPKLCFHIVVYMYV